MWMTDLEKQVLLNNQADNPPGRPTRPCETNSNKTLHCALVQLLVACPTVHTSRLDQTRPKPTKREFLWNAFLRLRPARALSSLHLQWASIFLVKILCIGNWKKRRKWIFSEKSVHLSPSCQTKSQRLEQLRMLGSILLLCWGGCDSKKMKRVCEREREWKKTLPRRIEKKMTWFKEFSN